MSRDRVRLLLACLATLAILLPIGFLWQRSWMPSSYSVMSMGYLDYGGGARAGHTMHGGHSVADLTVGTDRPADKVVHLTARKAEVRLADGQRVDGYTLNGLSPGPLIEVRQGQLLEVHLANKNVPDGITLHWHGLDVPNAEDGVAGVTQDAVMPGQSHTYRFVAHQAGTYWYHSHQVSHEQVIGGLLGPLVVRPPGLDPRRGGRRSAAAHVRRVRDPERPQGGAGRGPPGPAGAPPGGQQRQRADARVGGRPLPGASPSTVTTSTTRPP